MATVNKDFRVKHGLVVEGTNATVNASDIITEDAITGGTQTNITVTYNPTTKVVNFAAENGVADSNTDALTEGTTNKYFTDERAQDAVGNSVGTGLTYNDTSGAISVTANTYDAFGAASAVAGNLTTHTSATEAHGATGAVVGTTNTQTLTNKTLTTPKINEDVALTATATELNLIDGSAAGTIANGKAVVYGSAGEVNATTLQIAGTSLTATATELNYVDGVTSAIQTQLDGKLDESGGTMTGNIAMGTNKITGLGTPTDSADAATKGYVDGVAEGLHIHEAARVAVQGNISIATGLENGDTAGGVTLVTGDRVLLKDQTNTAENGIYVVQASGQALRATDFDTATEVDSGDFVFVSAGTYANTGWVQVNKPATIGTDPINFTQFSGAGTFLAGNGLLLDGVTFEIDDTITATKTYVDETFVTLDDLPGELDDYVPLTQKGSADGVATLDAGAQVPLNQLENVTDIIDGLTTSDISEGTNLYFTDTRAVDALEAVVPNFTAIEVNSLAKQIAATSSSLATVAVTAYAFPKATYRAAKFIVKIDNGNHNEVTEVLLSLDSSDNIAMTEYAIVGTNGSRGTITADISGADVRLRVTPVNDSTINVVGTLLV